MNIILIIIIQDTYLELDILRYQKVLENKQKSVKEVNKNGHIEFVHGSKMFLSNSQMFVKTSR